MGKYKKTLKEDLGSPLGNVSRGYIRKPVTVILTILFFTVICPIMSIGGFACTVYDIYKMCYNDFVKECWRGVQ